MSTIIEPTIELESNNTHPVPEMNSAEELTITEDNTTAENSPTTTEINPELTSSPTTTTTPTITKAIPTPPLSSLNFLRHHYQDILGSYYLSDFPNLEEVTKTAHALLSSDGFDFDKARSPVHIKALLEPFVLACQSKLTNLQRSGIEGLSKLINHQYIIGDLPVATENRDTSESSAMSRAIKAICECFENETTDEKIQTLIVQSLFTAISSPTMEIHQESLMRSIRTIYNIFLLSNDINNQTAAQGTLVQITRTVFERIKISQEGSDRPTPPNRPESSLSTRTIHSNSASFKAISASPSFVNKEPKDILSRERVYLKDDPVTEKLTMEKVGGKPAEEAAEFHITYGLCELDCDVNIQDGFLLFRALCKLAFKRYNDTINLEMRGISLRSKLLALYLVMMVISDFPRVFTHCKVYFLANGSSETPRKVKELIFAEAIKPYVGICLKSNFNSKIPKIFELNMAIFEGLVTNLRDFFKWEIEACLRECIIPLIESKEVSQWVQHTLMTILLSKLTSESDVIKFIFINYDCASGDLKSPIFQQLSVSLSKMILSQSMMESFTGSWDDMDSFQKQAKRLDRYDLLELPSLTSDKFTSSYISRSFFSRATFNETWLQIRGIRCYQDIVESLLEMSGAQDDFFKFKADRAYTPFGSSLNPDDNIHPEEFTSSVLTLGDLDTDGSTESDPHQRGIEILREDILKGLEYLIGKEVLPNQPVAIAQFLLGVPALNKGKLSDFLGEPRPFASDIMSSVVETLDFTGLEFVTALRSFLNLVHLPGDGLKIDQLLLKFAEKYAKENRKIISNPDTAYALAYAVLLLNTQLYTPHFNLRVTKSEFIIDNRGIDHGIDLPKELLEEIYDQVSSSELLINPTTDPVDKSKCLAEQLNFVTQEPETEGVILEETMTIEKYLQNMVVAKELHHGNSDLILLLKPHQAELTRRMFEVLWMPYLATISDLVRNHNGSRVLSFSLFGFRRVVLLAGEVGHTIALLALFSALCSYCVVNSRDEMTTKIFASVVTMLDTAVDCGNPIRSGWRDVIQVLNRLAHLDYIPFYSYRTEGSKRFLTSHSVSNPFEVDVQQTDLTNAQRLLISVDRLIVNTVRLSGPSVVEFISYVVQVASLEVDKFPHNFDCLASHKSPRMFALNKLVHLVHINMFRIRLDWKRIWAVVGPFFCKLGCHPNESVASFAVESLYQMITFHLNRVELLNFELQKEILSPFAHIISQTPLISIKEMILQYMQQLIQVHSSHIRSGWKAIVQVLGCGAENLPESLASRAFTILRLISETRMDILLDFEVTKCFLTSLTNFAKHSNISSICFQAIKLFEESCQAIIDHNVDKLTPDGAPGTGDATLLEIHQRFPSHVFWIPIFQCLMEMVTEAKELEVRNKAVELLFDYMYKFGVRFPEAFWHHLFSQSLFPLITNMQALSQPMEEGSQLMISTVAITLNKFVDLFTHFFDKVFQFLDELLDIIAICLSQGDQTLCKTGADCLTKLLEQNVERMTSQDWQRIISIVIRLFQFSSHVNAKADNKSITIKNRARTGSALRELKNLEACKPLPVVIISPAQQLDHCLTIISLVEAIFLQNDNIFLKLNPDYVFVLLDLIERAYIETQEANATFDLSEAIKNNQLKKLEKFATTSLKLELNSLVCLFKVLLKMYLSHDEAYLPYAQSIEDRLIPLCGDSFRQFNALSELPLITGIQDIYQLWHEVVLRVGNFLCKASGAKFRAVFGPISADVILTLKHYHLSQEVKTLLSAIMERVDHLYIHPDEPTFTPTALPHPSLESAEPAVIDVL